MCAHLETMDNKLEIKDRELDEMKRKWRWLYPPFDQNCTANLEIVLRQEQETKCNYFLLPPLGYLYAYPLSLAKRVWGLFIKQIEQGAIWLDTKSNVNMDWFMSWHKAEKEVIPSGVHLHDKWTWTHIKYKSGSQFLFINDTCFVNILP